ncbi:MAG: SPOR domain-containing protein [Proteobacteria bacterium]|nr:SPOR domain-containing protein [Pseudomonadota bacterium]GBF29448.1 cell division protein DedD [bacterium MnTg03]
MDQNTKQRLVGITVVFGFAVIFLPMILDGSGVRKNTLKVVIPPQSVVKFNPKFEQKIIELHAKVEKLPDLEPQFIDENSSARGNKVERKAVETSQKDPGAEKIQPSSNQKTQPEVEVALVGGDTWVLQVGSFKDQKKALSQRDKLRKSNIAAVFVEKFKIDKEPVYRVRLGPFLNRDQSKIALNKIKAKHDIDGLIMKYHK